LTVAYEALTAESMAGAPLTEQIIGHPQRPSAPGRAGVRPQSGQLATGSTESE
jgi:hypothetical protein